MKPTLMTLMGIGSFGAFEIIVGETTTFALLLTCKTLELDIFYKLALQHFQHFTKAPWPHTLPNW